MNCCMLNKHFFNGLTAPSGPRLPHRLGFEITFRHTTLGGLLWTSNQPDAENYA